MPERGGDRKYEPHRASRTPAIPAAVCEGEGVGACEGAFVILSWGYEDSGCSGVGIGEVFLADHLLELLLLCCYG